MENDFKCRCHNPPPWGEFVRGKDYTWTYVIDAVVVYDDNGCEYDFKDIEFLLYFIKCKDLQDISGWEISR